MDPIFTNSQKFNGNQDRENSDIYVLSENQPTQNRINSRYAKFTLESRTERGYIKAKTLKSNLAENQNTNALPPRNRSNSTSRDLVSVKQQIILNRSARELLLQNRTFSQSPNRALSHQNIEGTIEFPISSSALLSGLNKRLSDIERREILEAKTIYYFNFKSHLSKYNPICREDFDVVIGDHINYRYEILEYLGSGAFGRVLKCHDHKEDEFVAVKVMKKNPKHQKLGEAEAKFLQILNQSDPEDSKNLIRMKENFLFRGYYCIVSQLLSINLYQFLRKNNFSGIRMTLLKRIATQLIIALKYVHSLGIIHCDIKPENVLMKQETKSSIKLIDFGTACEKNLVFHTYIQSRIYRSPEVVLGRKYNCSIDV